jgi:hypothetical protein
MNVEQITWSEREGWQRPAVQGGAQLVLVFGDRSALSSNTFPFSLASQWPKAVRIGCSTAGQILGTEVFDEGVVASAITFDHTIVKLVATEGTATGSAGAGARLAEKLGP